MTLRITKNCGVCDASRWPESDAQSGSLQKGEQVTYVGHVVGGMIRVVDASGRDVIVHPQATDIDD